MFFSVTWKREKKCLIQIKRLDRVDYEKVNKCKNRKNKKRDFWQINAFRFGNLSVIKKEKKKYESKKIKIKFFFIAIKVIE